MADQIGVVLTSAVEVATVVSFALGTQVPKWTASASPDATQTPSVRRSLVISRASCARPVAAASGPSTPIAKAFRQNAMARPGATAYATSGADEDTLSTATHSATITLATLPHRAMLLTVVEPTRVVPSISFELEVRLGL